mgnify:CR=1 FL=1
MESFALVRPEHLNHFGYLFGGQMLLWVDEFAWTAATREFPGNILVTRAMSDVEFKRQVPSGSILRFLVSLDHKGKSSLRYRVEVHAQAPDESEEILVFNTAVVFVAVDKNGTKTEVA